MPAHLQQPGFMAMACPLAERQTLQPHQAISLHIPSACVLRVEQGRVWVTTGARQGLAGEPDSGDMVLRAGQQLALQAGVHVVVESWPEVRGVPDGGARFVVCGAPAGQLLGKLAALLARYHARHGSHITQHFRFGRS
jgi:hypothetical protein